MRRSLQVTSLALVVSLLGRGADLERAHQLLTQKEINAIAAEISGLIAKDTVAALSRYHRVQASSGFARAAEYIANKAREYGLEDVRIERFPADGQKTYHTLKSIPGWEVERAELWEVSPGQAKIADQEEMSVALADYSQSAEVTAPLIDVGMGTSPSDYEGKDVKGSIVLAGGNLQVVHRLACDERGAAGILSYQQNQTTGWSGDYADNVRWGHLSPYNPNNKFAFMISLRRARQLAARLAAGEKIILRATVKAEMKPSSFDVVTCTIPGTDLAQEEIVYSCHLCHQKPGANDNASGAAAILEIARTLNTLIRRGEIARPRRTIRFIWPPEINGTLAFFASHPEIVARMKAAIHLDMVGGNYSVTKSVLHMTRTPASLPSCVSTVGEIFTEYVISESLKAASGQPSENPLISEGGSKESLVADITPYEMGSDHDVYQEGSFRIPTIYLRDWPDVFIHTNNDLPENIDPTKLKRSAFIAAASGYFLARATPREAARLAEEIFARAMARLPQALQRAKSLEAAGQEEEARNIIGRSLEMDAAALNSVLMLAPNDKGLQLKVEDLIDQLSGTWLMLTGKISQQRKGGRTIFILEPREAPQRPRGQAAPIYSRLVPLRKVIGPMNVYYYDYIADRASSSDLNIIERIARRPNGRIILYEILNLVDGQRSIQSIRNYIAAAYDLIPAEEVAEYLGLLEKIGVIQIVERQERR